ncbi:Transmembrane anterior posterior transformation protein 1 [Hypsibius exemplaris]|uniref:Transmembrane anterior posterior transformation protein 1 n=1 Tax=Hypsibius exemplaris TaxID=2072580 RepID=A0A1W0XEP7_HYPEX|nr:Transmembrane anterior posterior transformation protein 1 [Hypsibius exemplaris]
MTSTTKSLKVEADSTLTDEKIFNHRDQFDPSYSSTPFAWRNAPQEEKCQAEAVNRPPSRSSLPDLPDSAPLAFLFPPKLQQSKTFSGGGVEPLSPSRSTHSSATRAGSFWDYVVRSCRRDQGQISEDKERLAEKSRRIQTFLSVPLEVEKVMSLGTLQCADAFLYVFTIFPVRLSVGFYEMILLVIRLLWQCFPLRNRGRRRSLRPFPTACICEVIKGIIMFCGVWLFTFVDLSVMYHFLRGQAVVKLYIMFNMLEVADRLCSSFGQDILESLFWTASPPKEKRLRQLGIIPQIVVTLFYVMVHSMVVLIQITTLNIAMNSQNRALLIILLSNNFVEIKGSVFKKFEKKNLYQISCSDIRERFQFIVLLLMVIIRNMTELGWKMDNFVACLPDAFLIIVSEIVVDWTKHAFITKFNEIPMTVYQDYTYSLAYDFATSQLENDIFTDPSDAVVRRMGFVPIPLAIIVIRIVYQSFRFDDSRDWILFLLGFVCLMATKILINLRLLRWSYNLIIEHRMKHREERRCFSQPGTRAGSIVDMEELAERARSAPNTPPPQPRLVRAPSIGQHPLFANSELELTSMNENLLEPDSTTTSVTAAL